MLYQNTRIARQAEDLENAQIGYLAPGFLSCWDAKMSVQIVDHPTLDASWNWSICKCSHILQPQDVLSPSQAIRPLPHS